MRWRMREYNSVISCTPLLEDARERRYMVVVRRRRPRLYAWLLEGTYRGDDRRRHLIAMRRLQPHEDEVYEHEQLYSCLSILDGKAIGLLTYDSIVLAATSLVLSIFPRNITVGSVLVFIALVLSGVAASLSLYVIWIFWTETSDFESAQDLFIQLLDVRTRRTIAYRLAWVTSQMAMFLLIVGVLFQRRLF